MSHNELGALILAPTDAAHYADRTHMTHHVTLSC